MLQQKRFVTPRKPSLWLVCGAIDCPLLMLEKSLQYCALQEGERERLNTLHSEPKQRLPAQRATRSLASVPAEEGIMHLRLRYST